MKSHLLLAGALALSVQISEAAAAVQLKARHSGKCMTVAGTASGANVFQSSCTGSVDQAFELVQLGSAYQIRSVWSQQCVTVKGGTARKNNGQNIQQGPCQTTNIFKFALTDRAPVNGHRVVRFKNLLSAKCVEVAGKSTADGVNIHQWSCGNGTHQNFEIVSEVIAPAEPQLVLHYAFDDDPELFVLDSSPSGAIGEVRGAKASASGMVGQALVLEPESATDDRCIDVGSPQLVSVQEYTLMAWVRPSTISGYDPLRMEVLEKTDSYWLNFRNVNDKSENGLPVVRCGSLFDTPTESDVWIFADTPFGLPANQWYHLACTWDGFEFEIYVDGQPAQAVTWWRGRDIRPVPAGSTVVQNTEPLTVGCKNDVENTEYVGQWQGSLDEVRIFDRALTQNDIYTLFATDVGTPP